jgi:hypothetical protein
MSVKQKRKIQNTTYSSMAPYPPLEVGTAVGESVVLPKRYPSFIHTQLLLLLVLSCVTILNNKAKTLAFVSLLVQLNNKQSINLITSLCWSYFSRRNYFRVTYYTLSPKYPSFSSQRYRLQDHKAKPHRSRQNNEDHLALPLPLPLPQVRAQDNSTAATTRTTHTGSSADSDAYSTSPNLPRSGTLPNPRSKCRTVQVCTRRTHGQTTV